MPNPAESRPITGTSDKIIRIDPPLDPLSRSYNLSQRPHIFIDPPPFLSPYNPYNSYTLQQGGQKYFKNGILVGF